MKSFDPNLDLSNGEGEVVTVERDIYYQNVILFVYCIRDLVAFKSVDLIKANPTTLLRSAFLERYTLELDESDYDNLRKTPGIEK